MAEDCLVCQEHRLEVPLPGDHLVEAEDVVAFHLPPWPPADDVYLGYLMLTPRRHVAGFADLGEGESAAVGRYISRLSRALRTLGAERVYLAVVGHGVPHLHIHLIPRWPGTPADVSWLHVDDWEGARRGDFAAAEVMAGQIRAALHARTQRPVCSEEACTLFAACQCFRRLRQALVTTRTQMSGSVAQKS